MVDQEVKRGVPFREAYQKVAKKIEEGAVPSESGITYTHQGSTGNLCNKQIGEAMDEVLKGFNFEKVHQAMDELIN